MGHGTALHVGAADLSWDDLRMFALAAIAVAGTGLIAWGRWHLRDWRIRRAMERGDHDRADLLALDHDEGEPPRSLRQILTGFALLLIGAPALLVFQFNFADGIEHALGKGWGVAAGMLTIAFIPACAWLWQKVKRNAMSPEDLAALEEEEEHQNWMRAFFNEPAPGMGVAIAIVAVMVIVALYLMIAGLPA